mmetsp:Transcript_42492/g.112479  ORF Transcript_42492/g.112479 Transcript_42492/m.112479 type:complete len:155 (+) Transcript_42492:117-581(+)
MEAGSLVSRRESNDPSPLRGVLPRPGGVDAASALSAVAGSSRGLLLRRRAPGRRSGHAAQRPVPAQATATRELEEAMAIALPGEARQTSTEPPSAKPQDAGASVAVTAASAAAFSAALAAAFSARFRCRRSTFAAAEVSEPGIAGGSAGPGDSP